MSGGAAKAHPGRGRECAGKRLGAADRGGKGAVGESVERGVRKVDRM